METNKQFSFSSVLIVDDSEIDVLVNRRLIEITRFARNIIITHNGEEALQYLKSECNSAKDAPDWIFLDMHLPVLSGYDFIEAFKKLPGYICIKSKLIILSVIQNPESLKEILKYDFVFGQMDKPLTQKALLDLAETGKTTSASF